ncbi:hypothetical protein [Ruegeria sp. Ofav3-42]|uniref:hypothetical protein n=1 Tax=Ruegeria sp. Ofav3-42 TaxID=2917759 RepID=UPI001EF3E7C2|nr:hypothetical protein [Ruegeria sp. Ofav3-42]MCG7519838.1 hypothetical protein [Ruegeria sp. Ofav3-42]
MALHKIRFRDIALREEKENRTLRNRKAQLDKKVADNLPLSQTERDELDRINKVLHTVQTCSNPSELTDGLFVAQRYLSLDEDCDDKAILVSHDDGQLVFYQLTPDSSAKSKKLSKVTAPKDDDIVLAALTYGLMSIDAVQAPPVYVASQPTVAGFSILPDRSDSRWNALSQAYYSALGEAKGMEDLARLVLPILAEEGDSDGAGGKSPVVLTTDLAKVLRDMRRRGITADEIQLRRRVNEALNRFQHIDETGPYTRVITRDNGINPPDLESVERYNLMPDNIRLMGVMIVAAMFDEIRALQSLDYIVESSQRGDLVLGSSDVGQWLFNYWRDAPNRLSDLERRTFCAQTIGVPGGEPGTRRNSDFQPLMMHMCSNISKLINMHRDAENPSYIFQQRARKSCRDLAANLSLHGYGMAYYAAGELQKQLNFVIDVLGHPEIKANFAARDMWQVVDQINTLHLPGGPKNTLKYQTLATCGTIITAWLANNARHIMSSTGQLLDMGEVRNPSPYPPGQKAITHPNDFDFVNACELWLSESGIPDTRTQEYAAMREAPEQTSRPIQMPSVVQDMLGDIGDLGVGLNRQ